MLHNILTLWTDVQLPYSYDISQCEKPLHVRYKLLQFFIMKFWQFSNRGQQRPPLFAKTTNTISQWCSLATFNHFQNCVVEKNSENLSYSLAFGTHYSFIRSIDWLGSYDTFSTKRLYHAFKLIRISEPYLNWKFRLLSGEKVWQHSRLFYTS